MAKAPQAKKVSPARHAANLRFAAAGRASQVKARAKGKKPTKAQHQAGIKFAAAGRAAQARKRAGKKPLPVKKRAASADAVMGFVMQPSGPWTLGGNGCWPSCAAAALANHLLATTGIAASEQEILALHLAAGGGSVSIGEQLEAARETGLAGVHLTEFGPLEDSCDLPGAIAGVSLPRSHAVLLAPDGMMITWGRQMPLRAGMIEEAWWARWETG
jgi:hypothetical protein